jgi:hypothetical protein
MTCAFLGGGTGSWLGAACCSRFGWPAVCVLVGALAALPLRRAREPAREADAALMPAPRTAGR